ncbi:MAG: radical SAM protein [Paludibacteraceae bacterium]|nr:radical SAM protein [Paludibacteraceae bacterium]
MLFDTIIYGPIHSRRLGVSLGVNLLPTDHKVCTFDCVYCECGWNTPVSHPILPTREQVKEALEQQLASFAANQSPLDVITFSGNGEPTLHPDFEDIIADTCALRDRYYPQAKVSVLSNSTQIGREEVRRALMLCDNRILKLDSAIDTTMRLIDRPSNNELTVAAIVERLKAFEGQFTLQTCFLRGDYYGTPIDNTTPDELQAWYRVVDTLRPQQIMIYVIDRATPLKTLEKLSRPEMEAIAAPLIQQGYNVLISA